MRVLGAASRAAGDVPVGAFSAADFTPALLANITAHLLADISAERLGFSRPELDQVVGPLRTYLERTPHVQNLFHAQAPQAPRGPLVVAPSFGAVAPVTAAPSLVEVHRPHFSPMHVSAALMVFALLTFCCVRVWLSVWLRRWSRDKQAQERFHAFLLEEDVKMQHLGAGDIDPPCHPEVCSSNRRTGSGGKGTQNARPESHVGLGQAGGSHRGVAELVVGGGHELVDERQRLPRAASLPHMAPSESRTGVASGHAATREAQQGHGQPYMTDDACHDGRSSADDVRKAVSEEFGVDSAAKGPRHSQAVEISVQAPTDAAPTASSSRDPGRHDFDAEKTRGLFAKQKHVIVTTGGHVRLSETLYSGATAELRQELQRRSHAVNRLPTDASFGSSDYDYFHGDGAREVMEPRSASSEDIVGARSLGSHGEAVVGARSAGSREETGVGPRRVGSCEETIVGAGGSRGETVVGARSVGSRAEMLAGGSELEAYRQHAPPEGTFGQDRLDPGAAVDAAGGTSAASGGKGGGAGSGKGHSGLRSVLSTPSTGTMGEVVSVGGSVRRARQLVSGAGGELAQRLVGVHRASTKRDQRLLLQNFDEDEEELAAEEDLAAEDQWAAFDGSSSAA
mmetsp:Transcript_44271/g.128016  ORF Transcript_44271/g.128016 Transcript_44271/m.128016 type:complete len:624 (+) Transcript_44271:32-1903(+)